MTDTFQRPHQNTSSASDGGTAHGYLATPQSGSGPGLVVIQEWWGLTEHVKDVTDRFDALDAALAARAWTRTVEFLRTKLA